MIRINEKICAMDLKSMNQYDCHFLIISEGESYLLEKDHNGGYKLAHFIRLENDTSLIAVSHFENHEEAMNFYNFFLEKKNQSRAT